MIATVAAENSVLHRLGRIFQDLEDDQRREEPANAAIERKSHSVGSQP